MIAGKPRNVEFYFEFANPASWLAAAQVEEICARRSVVLTWHPIVPSGMPTPGAVQAAYRALDLRRYADHLGIRLSATEDVAIDASAAFRIHLLARETGQEGRWCRLVLETLWAEGRSLPDPAALVALAAGLDIDRARLRASLAEGDDGDLQRARREEARQKGLFMLPGFITSDQIYLGHDRVFLLEESLETPGRTTPFNRWFGARALSRSDGAAEYELIVTPRLANSRGVAHGGVVTSLLDTALGAAVVSGIQPEEWCATLQLSVQFREPVRPGRVVGRGRMVKRGRHAAFAEGELLDQDGHVLAVASGTWYIWPGRPNS